MAENKYEILNEARKRNKVKWIQIYKILDITKQGFDYHKKNLKENNVRFSVEQIKKLSDFLKIDKSLFF
ncbi:XRE family transcriptional regulator [Fusobacterium varium]|uniref:XRE family transcriptional regulator n=1 Tax=Fusobacterium varium TaxID=856 RepID=UPI0030D3DD8B